MPLAITKLYLTRLATGEDQPDAFSYALVTQVLSYNVYSHLDSITFSTLASQEQI